MNLLAWTGFSRAIDRIFGEVSVDSYRCVNMINKNANCTKCLDTCPKEAIIMGSAGTGLMVDPDICIACGRCVASCMNSVFGQVGRNSDKFWKKNHLIDIKKKKSISITCDNAETKGDISVSCLGSISTPEIISIIRHSPSPFRFENGSCETCNKKNGKQIFEPRLKDAVDFLKQVEGAEISEGENITAKGFSVKRVSRDAINVSRRDFFKLGVRNVTTTIADSLELITPEKKLNKTHRIKKHGRTA